MQISMLNAILMPLLLQYENLHRKNNRKSPPGRRCVRKSDLTLLRVVLKVHFQEREHPKYSKYLQRTELNAFCAIFGCKIVFHLKETAFIYSVDSTPQSLFVVIPQLNALK